MKKGYYTSGEFAKMAHISVRTIRFYDQKGILKPSFVNESGARFYSESDFVKLQQILLLKYLGFSLDDIKMMTVDNQDYRMLRNSLDLQLKLVKDRGSKCNWWLRQSRIQRRLLIPIRILIGVKC